MCVLTPEIKPVKPGFSPTHKPGFTGLKTGGFTRVFGYPGIRVAFPSVVTSSLSRDDYGDHAVFENPMLHANITPVSQYLAFKCLWFSKFP